MGRPGFEGVALRIAVGVAGLVPVGAGLAGMLQGGSMTGSHADAGLDSHVRYLSGLLLAIGIAFWTTIPAIDRQGARFGLLTVLVVIGGLGRLLGVVLLGWPPAPMIFGLVMELGVTPSLWLWRLRWQHRAPG